MTTRFGIVPKRNQPATKDGSKHPTSRRVNWKIALLAIPLGLIALYMFGKHSVETKYSKEYDAYLSGDSHLSLDLLSYKDAFGRWNNNDVGNDVNTLMSFGKVYSRDGLLIKPDKGDKFAVYQDGKRTGSINGPISYINVLDGKAYYRKDMSRNIVVYDLSKKKAKRVSEGNYGEVFITNKRIYAIDFAKRNQLVSMALDGSDARVEVARGVNTFVVCGDETLYLDNQQRLIRHSLTDNHDDNDEILYSDVDCFFLNGSVMVESGNSVIDIDIESILSNIVYESDCDRFHLVGAAEDAIFFQEDGLLKEYLNDVVETLVEKKYKLYESLVIADDEICHVVAIKDGKKAAPTCKLLTLKSVKTKAEKQ